MAELSKHQGGLSSRSTAAAQSSTKDEEATASENSAAALALVACQAALVTSPAAPRAALDKHHSSIDPDVAHTLLIVGGYNCKVGSEYLLGRLDPSFISSQNNLYTCLSSVRIILL